MHEEKDTLYIRDRDVQATNFSIFSTTLIDPIVILGCVSVGVFTSSINYYQEFIIYIYIRRRVSYFVIPCINA